MISPMLAPLKNRIDALKGRITAVVLGARTTQAVVLQRSGQRFNLVDYSITETPQIGTYNPQNRTDIFAPWSRLSDTPAPADEKPEVILSEHLKKVVEGLGTKSTEVVIAVGLSENLLRTVELPSMTKDQARQMLALSGRNHLQQELADYEIDCHFLGAAPNEGPSSTSRGSTLGFEEEDESQGATKKRQTRERVLVGAGRKIMVEHLLTAAKSAGLRANRITFTQTSLANALHLSRKDTIAQEVVAVLDLGFKASTISILVEGKLLLTRAVNAGADQMTRDLAEVMSVNYAAAESVKVLMPEKVEPKLKTLLSALTTEFRSAIDFFEEKESKAVSKIFLAGGPARSNFIIDALQAELGRPCERLSLDAFIDPVLPATRLEQFSKDAPQLAAAIGAAITWTQPGATKINLLIEEERRQELLRKDPVRRAKLGAGVIVGVVVFWHLLLKLHILINSHELKREQTKLEALRKVADLVVKYSKEAGDNERAGEGLRAHALKRAAWANSMNALQHVYVDGVQVVKISMRERLIKPVVKPKTKTEINPVAVASAIVSKLDPNAPPSPGLESTPTSAAKAESKPEPYLQKLTLVITARNTADQEARDRFIERLIHSPYFKAALREFNPVVLTSRLPRQVDPLDPEHSFSLFTVECTFRDQVLGYD